MLGSVDSQRRDALHTVSLLFTQCDRLTALLTRPLRDTEILVDKGLFSNNDVTRLELDGVEHFVVKIATVGCEGVGKTKMLERVIENPVDIILVS